MLERNTVNKVMLMGRIGKDPRWHLSNGQRMLCFQVITLERIRSSGEPQVHEEWHSVRAFERLVDADKLSKGVMVYVQGRLQTKMFLDDNGVKHYRSEVIAVSVEPVEMKLMVV